jgi:hypothetical protein
MTLSLVWTFDDVQLIDIYEVWCLSSSKIQTLSGRQCLYNKCYIFSKFSSYK